MKNHERAHEGKKFECEHCGKLYVTKWVLANHIQMVHQKLLQFKCPYCDLILSSESNFKTHYIKKHLNKPQKQSKPIVASKYKIALESMRLKMSWAKKVELANNLETKENEEEKDKTD